MPQRYASLLLLFIFFCTRVDAQTHTISGNLNDTLGHSRLHRASVALIRAKDSVLQAFTRTDSTGAFQLKADSSGQYLLLVTYPNFVDYVDRISVTKDVNLPHIPMTSRTHMLQEFVLKKRAAAIVIKGDTTEYTADSFAMRSGASVEELLKKLPGLQVDKDGKITAQGEQVQKVLVDGEEFFSDDPAVVTKNLQAATVDKVQVYDKKSDQAAFTGIDDGEKTKTINLTLKEDKKKGLFGKAVASGGPSLSPDVNTSFFENQAMLNMFRGKQQVSVFGIMSNTGTTGLGWSDRERYGSGNTTEYDEESGMMYSYSSGGDDDLSGSWNGRYSGEGLPTVWTGGLHYANKWAKDAQHVTGNYRYAKYNIDADGTTTTQYLVPGSEYLRNDTRSTFRTSTRHGGDGLYEWAIDTSSNLKLTVGGDVIENSNNGVYTSATKGAADKLINSSTRSSSNESSSEAVNASLVYRKKFARKGRNISADVRMNSKTSDGHGLLQSTNYYYTDTTTTSENINQKKTSTGENFSINAQLSYTEPLSKISFLTLRYGARVSNSVSERYSFNRIGSEWSDQPDSLYSSSYGYDVFTQNASAAMRFVFKKYNFSLGGEVFHTSWQQRDRFNHINDRSRDYNNFAPTASIRYSFTKQSNLSLNYSGRTNQPTLDQLQPLQQNTDPLNISIGNPDLRQEFTNSVSLNFHSYKPLSGVYTYGGGSGNFTQNDITRTETFDGDGKRYYQYINVNGNYSFNFWGGYGFKLKKIDAGLRINANLSGSHYNSFINGQKNTSDNNSYGIGLDFDKDWKKGDKDVVSFSIGPSIDYNDNRATVSTISQSYWTADINADFFAELPWKLQLRSEAWYNLRQKTDVFTSNNNVLRWNASIGRKFLKGEKLEFRASVMDILNQNLGYNRRADANSIYENRYNTIRRHALFSLTYLFSGGTATVKNDDDDD